jgi:hypothetical protein
MTEIGIDVSTCSDFRRQKGYNNKNYNSTVKGNVKNCLTSGRSLQVAAISAIGTRTKLAT